jgi:crotonobetainyl-CoA:carnitine CoA-transferase CaiB-like acyl-CoA transferase
VIKVERPDGGDTTRSMGWRDPRDGVTLFWKLLGRGKRTIELDLKSDEGRATMLDLLAGADVLVENFRPGTLERLGLGPDVLLEANPGLVITRVTGFGQDGPYRQRPGFATIAEAMSGFAAISGEPEGPPLLPPIALADEVTALVAAFATMVAVHSGVGQVVDVSLLESLFQLMGPLVSLYGVSGELQPRMGAELPYSVPRNTYRCADGQWVALSTSAESVARRLLDLIGHGDDERFHSFEGRVAHRVELDRWMAEWIAERTAEEVLTAFEEAQAACAPVYDMADLFADPHVAARRAIVDVDGTPMQGLIAKLSATPGAIRWSGRPPASDQQQILQELQEQSEIA